MLDRGKHRAALVEILKKVYADPDIRTILGFKGGTAAMLFYDLPRMSVDLDFDLLREDRKELVFTKMKTILEKFGDLRLAKEKRFTLCFLVNYEKGMQSVKIDISKRKSTNTFKARSYLGVTALVIREDDMAAGKLAALLTRKKFAMRDVFDIYFFLQRKLPVNEAVLMEKAQMSLLKALTQAVKIVKGINRNQILRGMGELLDNRQKAWVKDKLIDETVFQLRLYREMLKK